MLPLIPIFLAGAIWTYNICTIVKRVGSKKSDENNASDENINCVKDEQIEDSENITISNSADAIRFIKSQQKSSGQGKRDRWGGGRYGK
jgi:hypothetical protein